MNYDGEIRKLAKSDYWQTIFNSSKKTAGIFLFDNRSAFSGLQTSFLQWLEIYNTLYIELAQKESLYLTKDVIADDERCNAYLYYRKQKLEQEWFNHQNENKITEAQSKHKFKNNDNLNVIDVDLRRR